MSELSISDKFLDFLKNKINEHVAMVDKYSYNEERLNKTLENSLY